MCRFVPFQRYLWQLNVTGHVCYFNFYVRVHSQEVFEMVFKSEYFWEAGKKLMEAANGSVPKLIELCIAENCACSCTVTKPSLNETHFKTDFFQKI